MLDKALAGKNDVAGNEFSPADTALFYVEYWAAKRLNMKLPPNVSAHYNRLMARPAVQRAFAAGGAQLRRWTGLQNSACTAPRFGRGSDKWMEKRYRRIVSPASRSAI